MSISALTCAGNVNLNANVTLGNASSDDITVTGSLASSISIKTTNTYNIGSSTLGLASIYFGANSQTVRLLGSGSMSATWTLTLPVTAGSAGQVLTTNGSGVTSWTTKVGAWTSFTPTGSWTGGNVVYTAFKRQVGENYEYDITVTCSGAPGTGGTLTITIPDTMDTTKMTATAPAPLGIGYVNDSSSTFYPAVVNYNTTTSVIVYVSNSSGTYGITNVVSSTVPMTFGAGDVVSIRFTAPISGLSV